MRPPPMPTDMVQIETGDRMLIVYPRGPDPHYLMNGFGSDGALNELRHLALSGGDLLRLRNACERWDIVERPFDLDDVAFVEQLAQEVARQRASVFAAEQFREEAEYSGDVTTFRSVAGLSCAQIEARIGFGPGRLGKGFLVYALTEEVTSRDFTWGDDTRFSSGLEYSDTLRRLQTEEKPEDRKLFDLLQGVEPRSLRSDNVRFEMYKASGFNQSVADALFDKFMKVQAKLLNVRTGPGRIVKIVSLINHKEGKDWWVQYPDSAVAGTPQWTLARRDGETWKKFKFKKIAYVLPGERVPAEID